MGKGDFWPKTKLEKLGKKNIKGKIREIEKGDDNHLGDGVGHMALGHG